MKRLCRVVPRLSILALVGCTAGGAFDPFGHAADGGLLYLHDTGLHDSGRPNFGDDSGFRDEHSPGDAGSPRLDQSLGATLTAADAPPPLIGGTLLVTHDDHFAIVADPERDRVVVVDLVTSSVGGVIALDRGDEPGRLAEDAAGHVYVALRRGGAVVAIDPSAPSILSRRAVCAAPRGIAYDPALDVLYVACVSGELVTLPASGESPTRSVRLDDDLRDVVVDGATIYVSRFRSAEVLDVDASGRIRSRLVPPAVNDGSGGTASASVAWRMIAAPMGGVYLLHQRSRTSPVVITSPGGYGGSGRFSGCGIASGIVQSVVTPLSTSVQPRVAPSLACSVLALDLATTPTPGEVAVAAPGVAVFAPALELQAYAVTLLTQGDFTATQVDGTPYRMPSSSSPRDPAPRFIAVAYTHSGALVAQSREPSALYVVPIAPAAVSTIDLGGASRADTGHTIFHSDANAGIACASCHPEGGDDGHVWQFEGIGARRTQSLRGGILGTAPFHWGGELPDFTSVVSDVFDRRMGGIFLSADHEQALAHWVDAQPLLPPATPTDVSAVARGRALFEAPSVGCTNCHSGDRFSSEANVDVGTGGAFQVPSLRGLSARAPYMHDGCARTLRDRFTPSCGGGDRHGSTSALSAEQIADLVAYLQTL